MVTAAHNCNPGGDRYTIYNVYTIYIYIYISTRISIIIRTDSESCHTARNSIKTPLCPARGLSHLNSDKPFWTRRYYTVRRRPPRVHYGRDSNYLSPRRPADELTAVAKTCRVSVPKPPSLNRVSDGEVRVPSTNPVTRCRLGIARIVVDNG